MFLASRLVITSKYIPLASQKQLSRDRKIILQAAGRLPCVAVLIIWHRLFECYVPLIKSW
jgi:hypothetical protein